MEFLFQDGSLMSILSAIPDHRMENKIKYKLIDILAIAVCAVISGAEGWDEIEAYGRTKADWLRKILGLESKTPAADTFSRVFRAMDPVHFQNCFTQWLQFLQPASGTEGQIALDGKTMRGSFDRATGQNALHIVSAWATANKLFLGQEKVDEKSNEITAIPKLLDLLDLKGNTVTMDAMGCQREIAEKIVTKGGDYILALKANQGNLFEDVKFFFDEADKDNFKDAEKTINEETDYGHGRIETRICTTVSDVFWIPDLKKWKDLKSITRVRSATKFKTDGKKREEEDRFYISNLPGNAKKIGDMVRGHWGIENSLHWVLDVTFNEDRCRIRKDNAPVNFSFLRKFAINLIKKANDGKTGKHKKSLRRARKEAGWSDDYVFEVLAGTAA